MSLRFTKLRNLIRNDKFPLLLLFSCFILIIYLLTQNYSLRKELILLNRISSELNNANNETGLLYKIIHKYLLKPMREKVFKWNLIIIFSPEDCPSCIEEISYWNAFVKQQKQPLLGCWGLVNHPYPKLVNDFIDNMGWEFPIYIISDSLKDEKLYVNSTPLKILMKDTNNIYYVEGPNSNWYKNSPMKNLLANLSEFY